MERSTTCQPFHVPSFKSRVPDGTGAVRNGAKILYRSLGAIVLQSLISIPNQKTLVGNLATQLEKNMNIPL